MSKNPNSVTFILGENMLQQNFIDAFHACFFIENCGFTIVESTMNGIDRDLSKTMRLVTLVDATAYAKSLSKGLPDSFHEVLGMIAWHQDMYDADQLAKAEKEAYGRLFSTTRSF